MFKDISPSLTYRHNTLLVSVDWSQKERSCLTLNSLRSYHLNSQNMQIFSLSLSPSLHLSLFICCHMELPYRSTSFDPWSYLQTHIIMGDHYILEMIQYLDDKKKSSFFEIDGYQLSQELILRTKVKTCSSFCFLF